MFIIIFLSIFEILAIFFKFFQDHQKKNELNN